MMNQNDANQSTGSAHSSGSNLLSYHLAQRIVAASGASNGPAARAGGSDSMEAQAFLSILAQLRQQQQQQSPSPVEVSVVAILDRETNKRAQELLKHHEQRLRETRLLLEQQEQQGDLQQHPLLMASRAIAAAKAAQNSILSGMGGAVSATAGGPQVFSQPAAATSRELDQEQALMFLAQERLMGAGNASEENCAGVSGEVPEEEADMKCAAESDEEKEELDNDRPEEGEGYDDKMPDDEYFEIFSATDDSRVIQETFPHKLYRMLHEVEKNGKQSIVSFLSHGKAFVVHKPKTFVEDIMPKYFTTCRFASFQRQLNLYGFRRTNEGREKGAYAHDFFVKDNRALCRQVKRQKKCAKATQQPSFATVASLEAPTQPSVGQGPSMSLTDLLAPPSSNPSLGALLHGQPSEGLEDQVSLLLQRHPGSAVLPSSPFGVASGIRHSVLQEALRRGLLTDFNSTAQQGNVAATSLLTAQERPNNLHAQEAELIIQHLQQQQVRPPRPQSNPENRR